MKPTRLLASALLALGCALAAAQSVPRVTVLPFEAVGVAKSDAQALTLFFETALQNTGLCQIIEQTEVDKILRTYQYVLSDFNDPTKAVEIGRLIPANHIVLGTVGTLSGKYYINVKMIDLRTGTNVGARNATATALDALSASLTDVAQQMLSAPGAAQQPSALVIRQASLSFFESGPEIPPPGERSYTGAFDTRLTRFINWELNLRFDTTTTAEAVQVEVRFYRADGSVFGTQTRTAQIEAGWDWYSCWNNWGAADPNNWAPGTYTVQALVSSKPVASAAFVVR